MLKPLRPIVRPPQPTEAIRATLARHVATARHHTPFGILPDTDRAGLVKRTALDCGVTVDLVQEVCRGN